VVWWLSRRSLQWHGDLADPKTHHTRFNIFFIFLLSFTTDQHSLFTAQFPIVRYNAKTHPTTRKKSQNPETFYQSPGSATQPSQFLLTIPTSHGKPSTSHQLARQPAQCTIRPSRKPPSIFIVVCLLSSSILYLLGYRHRHNTLPGEMARPLGGGRRCFCFVLSFFTG